NPTPPGYRTGRGGAYEIDLRDKKYGRVYRVVYTKAKPEPLMDLQDANDEALVGALKHTNQFWRLQAQRLLVENGVPIERFMTEIERKHINIARIRNASSSTLREKLK